MRPGRAAWYPSSLVTYSNKQGRELPIRGVLGSPAQCPGCGCLSGAGFLRVFSRGYGTDLLHQAHHVELAPELYDLTVDDPIKDATWRGVVVRCGATQTSISGKGGIGGTRGARSG